MNWHGQINHQETPGLLPAIGNDTKLKTTFGTAWAAAVGLVGAAIWGTMLYIDVQTLKTRDVENTVKIEQIRNDVARLRWIMEPLSSRAILGSVHNKTQANP